MGPGRRTPVGGLQADVHQEVRVRIGVRAVASGLGGRRHGGELGEGLVELLMQLPGIHAVGLDLVADCGGPGARATCAMPTKLVQEPVQER